MKFFDCIKGGLFFGTILAVPCVLCSVIGYSIASTSRDEGYEQGRAAGIAEAKAVVEDVMEAKTI